jgi:hypothetical protein
MSFITELKEIQSDIEPFVDKLLKLIGCGALIAESVSPLTGAAAPEVAAGAAAAGAIANGLSAALDAHQAAVAGGADPTASATALAASAIQTVVNSGVIKDTNTTTALTQAATIVQNATPEIQTAVQVLNSTTDPQTLAGTVG